MFEDLELKKPPVEDPKSGASPQAVCSLPKLPPVLPTDLDFILGERLQKALQDLLTNPVTFPGYSAENSRTFVRFFLGELSPLQALRTNNRGRGKKGRKFFQLLRQTGCEYLAQKTDAAATDVRKTLNGLRYIKLLGEEKAKWLFQFHLWLKNGTPPNSIAFDYTSKNNNEAIIAKHNCFFFRLIGLPLPKGMTGCIVPKRAVISSSVLNAQMLQKGAYVLEI
jgi:hypothetical protein